MARAGLLSFRFAAASWSATISTIVGSVWVRGLFFRSSMMSSSIGFPETNDDRYLAGLAKPALLRALETYRSRGLEAFREAVSVLPRQEHVVDRLPERVAKIEAYPSLLGEYRHSRFRYSSPWEATLFVRLTPEDTSSAPVILEFGAKGWAEGIVSEDVEIVICRTRDAPPGERPGPVELRAVAVASHHQDSR